VIAAYALTIFFSAFLLFQVQPLISKFILPWFGGSPAVWTAAMLFFQVTLFGGYLYAHLTSTYLQARGQFVLHASLLALATIVTLVTQISPGESLKPTGAAGENPLAQILVLLGVTVGLPYFVLSSTGPLLQKWFSDAFEGASPYRLFALSNFGSLLALLSYPFFFEVWWDSREQAILWSGAFAFFAACCGFCAWWTFRARVAREAVAAEEVEQRVEKKPEAPPSLLRRAAWVLLPALASMMFLAFTNEVCQNVATVPLLWIIPLSLYLISFIVAFDHPRWYSRPVYAIAALVVLAYVANYYEVSYGIEDGVNNLFRLEEKESKFHLHSWPWQCGVYFGGLFLICMICHCELAGLKPSPRYLTSFFMTMSLGGALGGIFVNLCAPYIFKTFFELPLGMIASVAIAAALAVLAGRRWGQPGQLAGGALGVAAISAVFLGVSNDFFPKARPDRQVTYRGRNFYGLVSVEHRSIGENDENYAFRSGHIMHGRQWADPARRNDTHIAYWGPGSGCRRAMEFKTQKPDCRIGVVGLGIGTLAGFAKEGQYVRWYEINPEVIDIAQKQFHFLGDCKAKQDIVLGDARLQLERELRETGSHQFDVLCLDAFSGDAVPMHLLTAEAFAIYKQHLKPDGIIVVNITNTYLDLYPVVQQLAMHHGFGLTRVFKKRDTDKLIYRTYFALVTNDAKFLAANPEDMAEAKEAGREFLEQRTAPLWTDRYHSLWHVLQ
jgi:hypothetical protein